MSRYEEWLEGLTPQETRTGVRLDVRMYVYPDGHGNIIIDGANQPANSWAEAQDILRDVWAKASQSKAAPAE